MQEHVLICLSPSMSNQDVIKMASAVAKANDALFTALYVETYAYSKISKEDQERLQENIAYARTLGANIETAYGDDIAYQINEFCLKSQVTKVFIGYSQRRKWSLFKAHLDRQILETLEDLDVNIVYHQNVNSDEIKINKNTFAYQSSDLLISVVVLLLATLIGMLFHYLGFSEANTITVYILGVLIIAVTTSNRIYSLISSILSVLIFNFIFTNPRFTFAAYDSGYPVTFVIMFLAAFITSTLAIRLNQQANQAAQYAYRTKVLLETNRLLQKEKSIAGIKETTAKQIIKLLDLPVIICQIENDQLSYENYGDFNHNLVIDKNIDANVKHVYKQKNAYQDSNYYLPILSANDIYGVIIIGLNYNIIDAFENNLVLSIVGECALALEKELYNKKRQEAAIEAKNERLRADLLRSISHDLRTPLTSISGNASVLINEAKNLDDDKKNQLYEVIYDDSLWLINLVENLLSVTRLENGKVSLNLKTELIEEVINEALNHISRRIELHHLKLINHDEFILAKIDARLIMQVIINIIDNAIKYTPAGSTIEIETLKHDGYVEIQIRDDGPGINDHDKERLFEMFFTAKHDIIDSRRGLGLGLALCKSIIMAHDGIIKVADNHPKGTVFSFTLPIEEVEIHE